MLRSFRGASRGVLAAVAAVAGLTGAAPTTDSWDAVYFAGSKVGHTHTFIEPVKDHDRDLVRVRFTMELRYKRLGDTVKIAMEYGTIETPDGEVLRLDTMMHAAEQVIRVHGDAVKGKMTLILDGGGRRQQQTIDWGPDVRGPYAAEQSLARRMMKPGESRSLKMFMPDLNRVCDVTLSAKPAEEVKLGGGVARTLLRVDQTTTLDGKARPEFDATLWVDEAGQVMKSKADSFGGQVTYRTTKEGAKSGDVAAASFDHLLNSVVKVPQKVPHPETTREVRYRLGLPGDDPSQVVPADGRQSVVREKDKSQIELTVRTAGPDAGKPEEGELDATYTRPNALINSEDARVVAHARTAVGTATDPWEKSKRVVHWVARNIQDKNFSIGFATASEVARNLTGDCSEHAVLVAAMCRAEGVPARVVTGLVYAEHLGGFGFHMWDEVYVNRRWVAVDAAFDQETVDAVHIKLSDSSLEGVAPFETFLPIVRVLGKMTLEPLEIR